MADDVEAEGDSVSWGSCQTSVRSLLSTAIRGESPIASLTRAASAGVYPLIATVAAAVAEPWRMMTMARSQPITEGTASASRCATSSTVPGSTSEADRSKSVRLTAASRRASSSAVAESSAAAARLA